MPDLLNIKYPGVTFMVLHYPSPLRGTFGPQANQDFLHEPSCGFTPAVNHLLRLKKASVNWALTMINKLLEDFCCRQRIILCLPVWLLLFHYEETSHSCSRKWNWCQSIITELYYREKEPGATSNLKPSTPESRDIPQYPYSLQSIIAAIVSFRVHIWLWQDLHGH